MTSSTAIAGKVVALTGGARGIGAATAAALVRQGAKVAIGDLDLALAEKTAAEIGGGTLAVRLDVTDKQSFTSFLDEVESTLGPLDVMVNNAGIMPLALLLDEDDAMTAKVLDLNVRSLIVATREAARRMVPRRRGHIVNVASTAGMTGMPGASTYAASKAAVIAFNEAIEAELAEHGIHVSSVLPGIVRTELALGVPDLPGFKSITPDDVANAIVEALEQPRFEVFVPRSAGPMLKYLPLMPQRLTKALAARMGGADKVFLSAAKDPSRRVYEDRVSRD